jgi:hypothetical protein
MCALKRLWDKGQRGSFPVPTSVTITLTNEQLTALTEGLRYVRARDVTPPIETQATTGSNETPPKR